jgi:ankyrin repeat protein
MARKASKSRTSSQLTSNTRQFLLIGGVFIACAGLVIWQLLTMGEQLERHELAELERLLNKNPQLVSTSDDKGITLLAKVSRNGHCKKAALLIARGADVNAASQYGWTPLHQAVRGGCKDNIELLLEHGAELNARTERGQTALHIAARSKGNDESLEARERDREVAVFLLSKGTHVNAKDKEGRTPLDLAVDRGAVEIASLLKKHGGKCGEMLPHD